MPTRTTRRGLGALGGVLVAGAAAVGAAGLVRAQPAPGTSGTPGVPGMQGMMGGPGMLGAGGTQGGPGMPGVMARQHGADVEAHFIQEMIPHHEDAVAMAELALRQAEHPEIEQLAGAIKATQTREIEQMRTWYRQWYGAEVPPSMMASMPMGMGMGMGMGMAGTDPAALDGTTPFDKAFIEAMVPHHRMAVMMSAMALGGTLRPELRDLLQQIVAGQGAEIERLLGWYREWYSAAAGQPPAGPMHGPRWRTS